MADLSTQVNNSLSSLRNEFNVITHNLANVNTVGYKRSLSSFAKVLNEKTSGNGNTQNSDNSISAIDFSQGSMTQTQRPLDMALFGKGFFTLETPEGQLYTRKGMFHLNNNRQLVDDENRIVAGQSGAITVPGSVSISEITVSDDGSITAGDLRIGKLKLADFGEDTGKLVPVGKGCFKMTDEQVDPATPENIIVKQGTLESSNVEMVEELVDMIMVSRLYESNMKLVRAKGDASKSLMSVAMG
jgi:flagellar basal body rod protein FlgG